ncbi:RnfABCDGE type electron transport complex subunit D [Brucepastera parasyntrophica]|uniref:RnfABCDGE type electron transport complex subunit D n=1 Tax=Brucepastera parasyntrophica TaxID=2880008 RepID=UPI00210EFD1C|nr:RnfABCDGE type electron transport complex subunit D [Brucepastera parasyntrophica]ULQ60781.1 RnfABCDGE type electron transport complex subunit D [Brucepastera parasyntrophica]
MAESDRNEIYLSSSPHILTPIATRHIMLVVVLTLLPIAVYGVYLYGMPALVQILTAVISCVAFESLFRFIMKKDIRAGDFSAVITGLLLSMTLPPAIPVWMTITGSFFSIIIAKEFFGGLGANVFNPALSGRAFMFVSFSAAMSKWIAPRTMDAVSSATMLGRMTNPEGSVLSISEIVQNSGFDSKADLYWRYFTGERSGCIGESAIILILIAFFVLLVTKVIDWRAPVAMVATAVLVSWIAGYDPLLVLLSGGLLFGAVFMTTDYTTSPVTPWGRILFGAGCGLITAFIRIFGGYPEGVMFSILIMNSLVPFLNRIIPRKYGWQPGKKEQAAK